LGERFALCFVFADIRFPLSVREVKEDTGSQRPKPRSGNPGRYPSGATAAVLVRLPRQVILAWYDEPDLCEVSAAGEWPLFAADGMPTAGERW